MRKLIVFIMALFLLLPAASTNAAQTWQQIHDHIAAEINSAPLTASAGILPYLGKRDLRILLCFDTAM
ncbi:hypothetical protein [uncultured Campylobacter sp.]|uniref:hypothetical protein n=1 Tax=uncultured Campylobacter sp. TaxID=218934 RepID=UPI00262F9401|nr:hypothetical protein [uncultured Campylobacter sp.]